MMNLDDSKVRGLYESLGVTVHPILALPSAEAVGKLLGRGDEGMEELVEFLQNRQRRIALAETDPLEWGFELETWRDSDGLLNGESGKQKATEHPTSNIQHPTSNEACEVLGIFGGNRAGKTWYAVKRACQTAELFAGARIAILSEGETPSISTVQPMAWFYFKGRYGHLNGKRDVVYKINYSQANGFSDKKLVLPNGSEIYFLTYGQEAGDFEGWEFGAPAWAYEETKARRVAEGKFVPPNIGAVADESMPLKWLQMLSRRVKFRKAKLLWSFTPVKGITPAVKELVGSSAVTIESRPSELLPRKNLPDLPEGQMPYIRRCAFSRTMAIHFFSDMSPFGASPGRTYYDEIKELCAGKSSEYVERVAYGMARDSVARAFPKFGPWNVVQRHQLPAVGTNYFFCDPAGARNWFMLWVRVTPGNPGSLYIYRDWPDLAAYGEWAVATEREVNDEARKGWDGDPGPAQPGLGLGVVGYKRVILECERVRGKDEGRMMNDETDPYRARLIERARRRGEDLSEVREEIAERFVDPRAGASEHLAEEGGTCIVDEFGDEQRDSQGKVTGPAMDLTPASGVGRRQGSDENEGLTLVNELLDWNQEEKLVTVVNQPHLFVCEDAAQVRWMFENYTGRGGEKGACKDPADLARYMALAKLEYVAEGGRKMKAGRGF
jgi:hypothetical protein